MSYDPAEGLFIIEGVLRDQLSPGGVQKEFMMAMQGGEAA
jgi:hypothetical protein